MSAHNYPALTACPDFIAEVPMNIEESTAAAAAIKAGDMAELGRIFLRAAEREASECIAVKAEECGITPGEAAERLYGIYMPLDVLKAMRVAEAYCYGAGASNAAKNLRAAADAVAELIEQRDTLLNALKRALPHVEHAYHTHEDLDGSFWIDVVGCRSALARVQGVKS